MDPNTAQATYAAMLRIEVAPRLRKLGFVGSGASYVLPSDEWWQLVGFQKDRYSNADEVRFTVNLTKVHKGEWAAQRSVYDWLPPRPTGNSFHPMPASAFLRIGQLIPGTTGDKWWQLRAGRPSGRIAASVIVEVEQLGLPWLRADLGRQVG